MKKSIFGGNVPIAKTTVGDGVVVSTIKLWCDHAYGGERPQNYETMIFGGEHDQYQERCATHDDAVAMHDRAVRRAERSARKAKA